MGFGVQVLGCQPGGLIEVYCFPNEGLGFRVLGILGGRGDFRS